MLLQMTTKIAQTVFWFYHRKGPSQNRKILRRVFFYKEELKKLANCKCKLDT